MRTSPARALFAASVKDNDDAAISAAVMIAIRFIASPVVLPIPQHGVSTLVSFHGADNEFPANSALCKHYSPPLCLYDHKPNY
jgi:hypothetical protein